MRIFKKRNSDILDYLDKKIDKSKIKSICSNQLNDYKFMQLAINIAVSYIASAISSCEFKVYNNGQEVRDINFYKLNIDPNPNDTATRLKYMFVKKMILEGSSLLVQYNNNLYFAENFGICNDSINGYEFDGVTIQDHPINKKFTKKTSFYFRLDDDEINSLLNNLDTKYQNLFSIASKEFRKGINNKWKLKISAAKSNDPEFQDEFDKYVNEQLKEFLTSEEAVYPEMDGYELEHINEGQSQNKSDSSDIRNLKKDAFDTASETFKIPVSMMYGNMSNLKEVVNQFITFAVIPYTKMINEELTRKFFSQEEILKDYRVEIDVSTINYRDIFDVAESARELISNGILNVDEIRPLIRYPKLNTLFSTQYWMTKNYSKIEDLLESLNDKSNKNLEGGDTDEE